MRKAVKGDLRNCDFSPTIAQCFKELVSQTASKWPVVIDVSYWPKRCGKLFPDPICHECKWERFSITAARPSADGYLLTKKTNTICEDVQLKAVHRTRRSVFVPHPERPMPSLTSDGGSPHFDVLRNLKSRRKTTKCCGRKKRTGIGCWFCP